MTQYGDYIVHTDLLGEEARQILTVWALDVQRHLGAVPDESVITFVLDQPYTAIDPETGEVVHGFLSAFKFSL